MSKKYTVSKNGAYLYKGDYADCLAWIESEKAIDYRLFLLGWTTQKSANYFIL